MIESDLRTYLATALSPTPVYCELPQTLPAKFVVIDRHGGGMRDRLCSALISVQSYDSSLAKAAALNEAVKTALLGTASPYGIRLNSDGNFPDIKRGRQRYQAVFEIFY